MKVRLVQGLDSADSHHTSNSFVLDPGGAAYFQEGTFHQTQVESPYGPPLRCSNGAVYRYEPRTQKFDVYVTYGFANPHGHVFDEWGQDIVVDGTGAQPYHAALFSGHLDFPQKHSGKMPQVYQQRTRPCPGMEYVYSRHFPDEFHGNLLVANVIGFQGILRYKIEENGSSLKGTELEPILSSTDPNFRPVDLKVAPDGSLYFIDWQNPIIGHLQHALRDPSRDASHGRIYRITYQDRELLKPKKIDGEPIEKLLDLLKEPEAYTRLPCPKGRVGWPRNQRGHPRCQEVAGRSRQEGRRRTEHNVLEAACGCISITTSSMSICSSRPRLRPIPTLPVRAAAPPSCATGVIACRTLWNCSRKLADDNEARVRWKPSEPPASSPSRTPSRWYSLPTTTRPICISITCVGETMRALEPSFKKAISDKKPIHFTTAAGARYFLKAVFDR